MGVPNHLTCLLRKLYMGQAAIVRTRNWFKIEKGVLKCCILSPYLFNFYAEYITGNARLDEPQSAIIISLRNISNLRYADDTILIAESEEELKNLLMRVKEEGKSWLKT